MHPAPMKNPMHVYESKALKTTEGPESLALQASLPRRIVKAGQSDWNFLHLCRFRVDTTTIGLEGLC